MAGRFFEPDGPQRSGGPAPKRVALVVGNGAYRTNRLHNPPADAEMIGEALKSLAFDVELLKDATNVNGPASGARSADASTDSSQRRQFGTKFP